MVMGRRIWNEIPGDSWSIAMMGDSERQLTIEPNEFVEQPICLTLERQSGRNSEELTVFMSSAQARQAATKLILLADAADAAGKVSGT